MFSPCSALHFRTTTTDHDIDTEITAQHRHSYTLREDLDAIVRANRRLAVKKKSPLGEAFPPKVALPARPFDSAWDRGVQATAMIWPQGLRYQARQRQRHNNELSDMASQTRILSHLESMERFKWRD
ncbi:hypothetical protein H101_06739 [Trichophyton interdigitale H6]|nr:hypothetical protein H101_06739 [Trichophyton interdigitale H6]